MGNSYSVKKTVQQIGLNFATVPELVSGCKIKHFLEHFESFFWDKWNFMWGK